MALETELTTPEQAEEFFGNLKQSALDWLTAGRPSVRLSIESLWGRGEMVRQGGVSFEDKPLRGARYSIEFADPAAATEK